MLLREDHARNLVKRYHDRRFYTKDFRVLCEAYRDIPFDNTLLIDYNFNKYDHVALMMHAEILDVSPETLLLREGVWDSIKKVGSWIGAKIAEPFKMAGQAKGKYGKAKEQGATGWQSVKHGMTALPQLFKHGTHFGQGKASEKAKKAYDTILKQFEQQGTQQLKELVSAAKELEKSDFPNNARPEDFRLMLMGKETFADIKSNGLGGLLGGMLEIRETQQEFVNNGGDISKANAIIGRMRKLLQYHLGELHDTYQSLENKNRRAPLIRGAAYYSLYDRLYDSNHHRDQFLLNVNETIQSLMEAPDSLELDRELTEMQSSQILDKMDKDVATLQKALEDAGAEDADADTVAKFVAGEDIDGLSDKQLQSIRSSASALRPLIVGLVGALMAAVGLGTGGSIANYSDLGDDVAKWVVKNSKTVATEHPKRWIKGLVDSTVSNKDKGWTHMVSRTLNKSHEAVQNMSIEEFAKAGRSDTYMKFLGDDGGKSAIEAIKKALAENPGKKVKDFFTMSDPMASGVSPNSPFHWNTKAITKRMGKVLAKQTKTFVTKQAGKMGVGAMATVALPHVLATAGVGVAASGLAIAALRKFAKNRKKTLLAAIDLLEDIKGPTVGSVAANPPENGPIDKPDPEDIQGLSKDLPLDLFKKTLKDQEYEKPDELTDKIFKEPKLVTALTSGYRRELNVMQEQLYRWGNLAGLNEDIEFNDFSGLVQKTAKNADLPEPSEEQLGHGAHALNVTPGIGNVTDLPGLFAEKELEIKVDALEKSIEQMKLENNNDVRKMLDQIAAQSGLDPEEFKGKENSDYLEAIGGAAAFDGALIEDLEEQLLAANAGLDEKEAELAAELAKVNEYIEENQELINSNKKLKSAVEDAMKAAGQKDIVIGSLADTIKQKDELGALKDQEIDGLTSKLEEANRLMEEMKQKEESINNRLIDLRELWHALAELSGKDQFTFSKKGGGRAREKNYDKLAQAFLDLGDEYPALKDTGEIIKRSREAGVLTSYRDEWEKDETSSKKKRKKTPRRQKENNWRSGDLITERWQKLAGLTEE